MLKHVNGKLRLGDEEERQKEVPVTDKHPTPAATEARRSSELDPPSIAGIWKHRALHHDAISISLTHSKILRHITTFVIVFVIFGLSAIIIFIFQNYPCETLVFHLGPFQWIGWAPTLHNKFCFFLHPSIFSLHLTTYKKLQKHHYFSSSPFIFYIFYITG